jgi:hypothetical protein
LQQQFSKDFCRKRVELGRSAISSHEPLQGVIPSRLTLPFERSVESVVVTLGTVEHPLAPRLRLRGVVDHR